MPITTILSFCFFNSAYAEEASTPKKIDSPVQQEIVPALDQTEFVVINGGREEDVSLIRVSLASKKKQEVLRSISIGKLQSQSTKLMSDGTLSFCTKEILRKQLYSTSKMAH